MPIPLLFALGTWALAMAGTSAFVYYCTHDADVSANGERIALKKKISLFRSHIGFDTDLVTESGPVQGHVYDVVTENGTPAVLIEKGHAAEEKKSNTELILIEHILAQAFHRPAPEEEEEENSQQDLFESDDVILD